MSVENGEKLETGEVNLYGDINLVHEILEALRNLSEFASLSSKNIIEHRVVALVGLTNKDWWISNNARGVINVLEKIIELIGEGKTPQEIELSVRNLPGFTDAKKILANEIHLKEIKQEASKPFDRCGKPSNPEQTGC